MYLRKLTLEQWGNRSHLQLDNLCPGINLVYGPPGSGKTALAECIPWILFGSARASQTRDEASRAVPPHAALEVTDATGHVVHLRRDDKTLCVDDRDWHAVGDHNISVDEYRRVYCIGDSWGANYDALAAPSRITHGLDGARHGRYADPHYESRLKDLYRQEKDYRQQLARLPHGRDVSRLRAERRGLEDRMADLRDMRTRQLDRVDHDYRTARREQELLQGRCEKVDRLLARVESRLARRQALLDESQRYADSRPGRAPAIDSHWLDTDDLFSSWERLYTRITEECQTLRLMWHDISNTSAIRPSNDRWDFLLRTLDTEIRDLESSDHGNEIPDEDVYARVRSEWRRVHSWTSQLLSTMRRDLTPADATHLEPHWRDADSIPVAIVHLERSAQALRGAIERMRDGYNSVRPASSSIDVGIRSSHEMSALATARHLHHHAVVRLQARRDRISDLRAETQHELSLVQRRLAELQQVRRVEYEAEMDSIQRRIEAIERDVHLVEERERVERALHTIGDEIRRLRGQLQPSAVVATASRWLDRMSQGRFSDLEWEPEGRQWCVRAPGHTVLAARELSSAWQGVVHLAIRLAWVDEYRRAGVCMPLLIDEPPIAADGFQHDEFARILRDLARDGQQMLLFTSDRDIAQRFERHDAHVYTLVRRTVTERVARDRPAAAAVTSNYAAPGASPPSSRYNPTFDNWDRQAGELRDAWPWPRRPHDKRATIPFAESNDLPAYPAEDRDIPRPALRYYLRRDDAVVQAPAIGPKMAERLCVLGIATVDQLLTSDPSAVAERLRHRAVTPDVVRDWQDQAQLVCRVPFLRGHDASLLVGCGVRDPRELAHRQAESLLRDVHRFLDTPAGHGLLRGGPRPNLAEVQDWIHWARDGQSHEAA